MKYLSLTFVSILTIITSCTEAPEFPDTPKIEFKDVIFKDIGSNSDADSLIIFIDFEDGDGDLGLDAEETSSPYNQKFYFSNKTGRPFNFSLETLDDLMKLDDIGVIDTLPPFSGASRCLNWDTNPDIFFSDGTQLQDTVYFQFNPRHNNIFVEFLVDRGSGFVTFDWRLEIDCSTNFDGRFPILKDDSRSKALEGTIRYKMVSVGFKNIFGEDRVKLRVTILDRSGKYSNTVESPPFRLSEID